MWGGAGLRHSEVMENCLYCYLSIKLCTLSGGGRGGGGGGNSCRIARIIGPLDLLIKIIVRSSAARQFGQLDPGSVMNRGGDHVKHGNIDQ